MTWTFDPDNPTDRDRIRVHINDFDVDNQKFSDEIIDMMLSEEGDNIYEAAIRLALILSNRYATKSAVSLGPLSVSFTDQSSFYSDLADRLRKEALLRLRNVSPFYSPVLDDGDEDRPIFVLANDDNNESYPTVGD